MNLSQLRYVKAVAETESFTQAAEQCFVTQPTLSNGIAQLEEEFEERLFTRTTRTVSLTPFGEHLLPFVVNVLTAQSKLLHEARNFVHPAQKTVRIGISPLLRSGWLAPMLEIFHKAHPEIEVVLHEQNMADLYHVLDEELLDFVFGVADTRKTSWNGTFLYREPLYYIPRGSQIIEGKSTVKLEDIADETFVMVPNVCGLAKATRALFRSNRRKLKEYSGEALSYLVLEEWASLGLGSAILPKSKLQSSESKAILLTDKTGRELTLEFEAIWLNTRQQPACLQQFAEFLQDYNQR
ncbi:LysR family transcriptional regulator [Syntrophotalea carbinolica]|nr:LysR family transcriptional regulator [Syntrophotalea carbinolica]